MNLSYLEERISEMGEGESLDLSIEFAGSVFPTILASRHQRFVSTFEQIDLWAGKKGLILETFNHKFRLTKPEANKKPASTEDWIKINTEADLPINNPVAVYWTLRKLSPTPMFTVEPFFDDKAKSYWMKNYSHYLLIKVPSLPADL